MNTSRSKTLIPCLVTDAKKLAESRGFTGSCTDETGRLLSVLAGQVKAGKILEIGTGFGVGSAWMLSNIQPDVHFVSVDIERSKVELVSKMITHSNAEFVCGDWKEITQQGQFQFIFADAATAKTIDGEILAEILEFGGLLLMDDFTPEEYWLEDWRGKPDPVREFWLNHVSLTATEIYLTPRSSAILAVKNK